MVTQHVSAPEPPHPLKRPRESRGSTRYAPAISSSLSTVLQFRIVLVVASFESKYAFVSFVFPIPLGHDR